LNRNIYLFLHVLGGIVPLSAHQIRLSIHTIWNTHHLDVMYCLRQRGERNLLHKLLSLQFLAVKARRRSSSDPAHHGCKAPHSICYVTKLTAKRSDGPECNRSEKSINFGWRSVSCIVRPGKPRKSCPRRDGLTAKNHRIMGRSLTAAEAGFTAGHASTSTGCV